MTNIYDEYPPLVLGDKVISPAGSDYVDTMGYEYYFGIMQMWDRLRPDPVMYPLMTDNNGKLFYWDHHDYEEDDNPWSILESSVQDAFQAYVMSKLILGEVTQNRLDCDHRESA